MRKQTKVLLAATLFTLGASFSSLAALKSGTWVLGDEGWQYADKEGEFVEGEWCMSGDTEYWVNDEGYLGADEWVTEGEYSYYVKPDGSKAKNEWRFIFGEDDEDAEEESWFYFDAKGRMLDKEAKKINGQTYYFAEDGKMLTGWVDSKNFINANEDSKGLTATADVVFCDENGARVNKAWLYQFPWNADLDEMYEGEDEEWFYAGSSGKLEKGKKAIDGLTYFFDADTRAMLEGWVIYDGTNYVACAEKTAFDAQGAEEVYYATEDAGYAKKNGWRELENPMGDEFWYHFDKLGRVFLGTATESNAQAKSFDDGEEIYAAVINDAEGYAGSVESKKIDNVKYFFNPNGEMIDGLVEIDGKLMYLDGGAAQTGKVTLTDSNENDYTFYFAEKTVADEKYEKYVAVDGNKDGYCYVNGLLVKSEESGVYEKVDTVNGSFIVDYRGKIQHNEKKVYEGVSVGEQTFQFNEDLDGASEDSLK